MKRDNDLPLVLSASTETSITRSSDAGEIVTFEIDTGAILPADRNPALVYLSSLSEGSRPAMCGALAVIAAILLSADEADGVSFPWHAVRYQHAQAVRTVLMERDMHRATAYGKQDAVGAQERSQGSMAAWADGLGRLPESSRREDRQGQWTQPSRDR